MLINEVSKLTGFSTDTIRYYEKIGLMNLDKKGRGVNNYRYFGRRDLETLFQIKALKKFGFTLREIKKFLILDEKGAVECSALIPLAEQKVSLIDQKIEELRSIKAGLIQAK